MENANLWLLEHLDLSVLKENTALSPQYLNCSPNCGSSNVVYLFHAKHDPNNTQVVMKVLNQDSITTNQPIGVPLKVKLSNKHHFMLTLKSIKTKHLLAKWTKWVRCGSLLSCYLTYIVLHFQQFDSLYLL